MHTRRGPNRWLTSRVRRPISAHLRSRCTIPATVNRETDIATRRKRLRFRCWHRGSREADLLLGRFADSYLDRLDALQIARLERLLEYDDPDIWDWTVRGVTPPAELDHDVLALLRRRSCAS